MSAPMKDKSEYTLPVTVEFEDVDSYRIAHHAKLITYLERARVRMFTEMGLAISVKNTNIILYNLNIRYLKTAKLLDKLMVSVFIKSLDSLKVVLDYRIRRGEELLAKATTDLAFIDTATGKIVPVPEEYGRKLGRNGQ